MRGKKAKRLRREVYGDLSLKARRWFRVKRTRQVVRDDLRQLYRQAKRRSRPTGTPGRRALEAATRSAARLARRAARRLLPRPSQETEKRYRTVEKGRRYRARSPGEPRFYPEALRGAALRDHRAKTKRNGKGQSKEDVR